MTKFPNESIGRGKITRAEQVLRDKEVEFGEIPRTSAGKVQKYLLRQEGEGKVQGKQRRTTGVVKTWLKDLPRFNRAE